MTSVVDINEIQVKLKGLLSRVRAGDEIVIEENGKPLGTFIPAEKKPVVERPNERILGLGRGTVWMSDDFEDDLPDELWDLDEEL